MLTCRAVMPLSALALPFAMVLFGATSPICSALAAENDAKKADGHVVGILIDLKPDSILVKADGEDEPVKYLIDTGDKKVVADRSGVLIPHRVQLTFTTKGDARQLTSIKRHDSKASGTVTGEVVKNYGWWIEVKPKSGPADGYALNYGEKNKDLLETFKDAKAGDLVTVKFATDAERHRIQTLHKNAASDHSASAEKHGATSAADHKAAKDAGKVAGILIDRQKDWITVKADGEDEPVKYVIEGSDKKLQETMKMVFNACRVQLTYKTAGDSRQLTGIKRQVLKQTGTVTGDVVKVYNDFWIEVKPKSGVADAYAPGANYNDKEFMAMLKGLKPGESVTITYNTDFERHRITSMRKNPGGKPKSGG